MPIHFDKMVRGTEGDRGKTTRRNSTVTVRGPEGEWIADQKEELAERKDEPRWCVRFVRTGNPFVYQGDYDYPTEERAEAHAKELRAKSGIERVWTELVAK